MSDYTLWKKKCLAQVKLKCRYICSKLVINRETKYGKVTAKKKKEKKKSADDEMTNAPREKTKSRSEL
ncbi:hypothetical protein POVWA2_050930 [Plasmodium ovale wallikeri]|uniref:Uncharacterized protein n=1 Tax=Plasmodium ovale wallikeri TaxID=864142 RepID=A0A1A8ZN79_PLAOA|nr:hypothetical protein POVWA1_051670 [Plasmodium ovale wallikeri]SBT45929.1 hypothetical protein POVWA2_050930 [Plasmodium ovale wallikeri]